MVAIIPLMETMDVLITFAQKNDVFACDFVAALEACEEQLMKLYIDIATTFYTDELTNFNALLQLSHFNMFLRCDVDLNTNTERLMCRLDGTKMHAFYKGKSVVGLLFPPWLWVLIKSKCKGEFCHCLFWTLLYYCLCM